MREGLLLILFIIFSSVLHAQKDSLNISSNPVQKNVLSDASNINLSIYPVPVRENYFTVKCDKEISFIKVTNIIGQDIYKVQFNNPMTITRILLDNPRRGIYLVTIIFSDGARVVKKIMIEQSE
jgi:hypothetical protein